MVNREGLALDYSSLDDEALLRLIVHSRKEALGVLYDRYSRLVFSLALHTVGDLETAEEITQDVFFRVWEKAGTYRSDQAKVSTWLASIARYRAIDVVRQRGARVEINSIGWADLSPGAEPYVDGPEESTEKSIARQRVRAAIHGLPVDQQQAIALAYYQGLSHSQIADQLGEPIGTVKTRIRLAMQKLRATLQQDLAG
jgi:RNA polymerase sigma-70 factor (ECF subfamily)